MDIKKVNKLLEIQLDIYERHYVTINNLKYITYSNNYVNGFVGEIPLPFSSTEVCSLYIKKLLLVFSRVQKTIHFFVPVKFNKDDTLQIYWKVMNDISNMITFFQNNPKFANIYKGRINYFEREIKETYINLKNIVPVERIKCLKNKIHNIL
jgi:hypothetical protein